MNARKKKIEDYPKYEDRLHEILKDEEEAQLYLQAALDDYQIEDDLGCFLLAIRDVVTVRGGMGELAKKINLSRESLYKALSDTGNPQFSTIRLVLNALGFQFVIIPLDKAA